jgi:peptidoglycan/xylan/chitin deacetylase (PgdA/CDA1 family)
MNRVAILMYHMVCEPSSEKERKYACPPGLFAAHMRLLRTKGFTPVGLDAVYDFLSGKAQLPTRAVAVTLDDGFLDNYENAFPVLQELGIPATIFVVGGPIGGSNLWMVKEGYPERKLMGWRELEEIRKYGITIGSHTINHHRVSRLAPDEAEQEIAGSKRLLENRLGVRIDHFAYPYGDFDDSVAKRVKEAGYKTACSIRPGFNSAATNPLELRRIEVYGTDSPVNLSIKLAYGTNDGSLLMPARYYKDRVLQRMGRWT